MTRKQNVKADICAVGLATMAIFFSMSGAAMTESVPVNRTAVAAAADGGVSSATANETQQEDDMGSLIVAATSPTPMELLQSSTGTSLISTAASPNTITAANAITTTPLETSSSPSSLATIPPVSRTISSTTAKTDELTPPNDAPNIMLTSEALSNSRRDSTLAYTSSITTSRPSISPYPELRHRITHARPYHSKHHHEHHLGPFFEEPLNATSGALLVGVHLATEAVLNCRVGMLKDKTVMWVRRTTDKFSLLTVGNNTYSGDPRIKVKFQYPNNWRLHINPMQKEDAGLYMCQVSTHPPRVFATNVTVLPPAIRVIDEQGHEVRDRYYKIGSTIELSCQVATSYLINNSASASEPNSLLQYPGTPSIKENIIEDSGGSTAKLTNDSKFYKKIVWAKDGEPLPRDTLFNISSTPGWLVSRLSILSAERSHSGVYSCSVSNSTSAIIDVQILNGETPAAVQHSQANRLSCKFRLLRTLFVTLLPMLYISC